MTNASADVLEWVEKGLWKLPEVPGVTTHLTIPGIAGSSAPKVPHPFVNVVRAARWEPEEADARIVEVIEYFRTRGLPFGWVIGPSTKPTDLKERLINHGLKKAIDVAGMALSNLHLSVPLNPEVHVRQLTDADEALSYREIFAAAFGMPVAVADVVLRQQLPHENSGAGEGSIDFTLYVASLGDDSTPVSLATSAFPFGTKLMYLSGAATLPEVRGKGVYTALVARRLADAIARGCTDALIQAVRTTSAPICAKLGFHELCNLEFFMYVPQAPTG